MKDRSFRKRSYQSAAMLFALISSQGAFAQCPLEFAAAVGYGVGDEPQTVTMGHLNDDPWLDLVVTNINDSTISVLLGTGNGTFAAAVPLAVVGFRVAIADLNGDTLMDLAIAGTGVSIMLGNGDGTFQDPVTRDGSTLYTSILVGRLDNNSTLDLVATNGFAATISVLTGNGNGTFANPVAYPTISQQIFSAIGDFNSDNHLDVAVAGVGSGALLLGDGNGGFGGPLAIEGGYDLAAGDLNGDGKLDLVFGLIGGGLGGIFSTKVALGNGNGTFAPSVEYDASVPLGLGDLNGDGILDIASSGAVLVGVGTGAFLIESAPEILTGPSMAVGDVDGISGDDVVIVDTSSDRVLVVLNETPALKISEQPQSQVVTQGQDATFQVTAVGAIDYQWRRDGVPLVDGGAVAGVNTDTLTISNVLPGDFGVYDVNVTSGCASLTRSHPVALSVQTTGGSDLDGDGDVDLHDYWQFQQDTTGPQ